MPRSLIVMAQPAIGFDDFEQSSSRVVFRIQFKRLLQFLLSAIVLPGGALT